MTDACLKLKKEQTGVQKYLLSYIF